MWMDDADARRAARDAADEECGRYVTVLAFVVDCLDHEPDAVLYLYDCVGECMAASAQAAYREALAHDYDPLMEAVESAYYDKGGAEAVAQWRAYCAAQRAPFASTGGAQ